MSDARPTVGITASVDLVSAGAWTEPAVHTPRAYTLAVQRAGGRPVVLVPDPDDARAPGPVLDLLDGLLISGGAGDVDPARYGEERHPETDPVEEVRDAYELALTREAVERDLPVLGICRGMEVLNVAYGGVLEQHLPDTLGHDRHRGTPGHYADHGVMLAPGSLAERAVEHGFAAVRSYHHQGVRTLGDGLRETGWAWEDGIIEAVEDPRRRFVLGVLWHPEEDGRSRVVHHLVAAAGESAGTKEAA